MIRRTFLKALAASPLGLLLKPKKKPTFNEALQETCEEFDSVFTQMPDTTTNTILFDPMPAWANECPKDFNRANDEVIIKALS